MQGCSHTHKATWFHPLLSLLLLKSLCLHSMNLHGVPEKSVFFPGGGGCAIFNQHYTTRAEVAQNASESKNGMHEQDSNSCFATNQFVWAWFLVQIFFKNLGGTRTVSKKKKGLGHI